MQEQQVTGAGVEGVSVPAGPPPVAPGVAEATAGREVTQAVSPPAPAGPTVIQTDEGAKNGQTKCPKCGATEISLNKASGRLRCHFCRVEWAQGQTMGEMGLDDDIRQLVGVVVGSGSKDIIPSVEEVVTFKCSSCGAEVVIDTKESTQARCHWCRNTLSMNQQIPNGAVPDMILPFQLTKAQAQEKIKEFVSKRKAFAHPKFKAEFTTENIMGVYLPYMVVDANARCRLRGQGERLVRTRRVSSGRSSRTVYDADLYDVGREFDLLVDDLTVESSSEKLNQDTTSNTNNIINSIMPFDVKAAVKYDSNYMKGLSSQKRDVNIDALAMVAQAQVKDIARHRINDQIKFYDRGVRWDSEEIAFKGQRWVSSYLPVWLYSYYEPKRNRQGILHYVAVNGRTGKTMGSVPVCQPRLIAVSAVIQLIAIAIVVLFFMVIFS
ncbi:TFIIB-type zinc ribbon-containing protein [Candidatus Saccharibacteria bacterium]|nr:TFIIB-type zinc ribbon-containing protein [Candidatus Saccharibacteria bacterium]